MFKLKKEETRKTTSKVVVKETVLDALNRVVGFVVEGRFTQNGCDFCYSHGLTPRELENVSETLQRNGVSY
jgi:hypothetical protein